MNTASDDNSRGADLTAQRDRLFRELAKCREQRNDLIRQLAECRSRLRELEGDA